MARLLRPIRGLRWTAGHEFGYGGFVNWVATVTSHCAGRCVEGGAKDGILRFRAAHFLRLTQREPRPDSAGGISRHITALSIQRVLNPLGAQSTGRGSVALRRPLMR
jgi:hypothetical protein